MKTLRHLCTRRRLNLDSLTTLYGEDTPQSSLSTESSPTNSIEMESFNTVTNSEKSLSNTNLKRRHKKAVMCSIHQPTSDIYELFTHIILMDAGRVVYQGTTEEAKDFFTR